MSGPVQVPDYDAIASALRGCELDTMGYGCFWETGTWFPCNRHRHLPIAELEATLQADYLAHLREGL